MKYKEIYETSSVSLGLYNPANDYSKPAIADTRKSFITLRHLNRLKHIRHNRQREHDKKMALLPIMYGDPQRQQNEIEAGRLELEKLELEITKLVDEAEIEQEQKSHIEDMAMTAMKRRRKQ
jgi:hypothetical protein